MKIGARCEGRGQPAIFIVIGAEGMVPDTENRLKPGWQPATSPILQCVSTHFAYQPLVSTSGVMAMPHLEEYPLICLPSNGQSQSRNYERFRAALYVTQWRKAFALYLGVLQVGGARHSGNGPGVSPHPQTSLAHSRNAEVVHAATLRPSVKQTHAASVLALC